MKVIGIILGILTGILGVYAMCIPLRTFLGLGWLLGILLLANGLGMVIAAFSEKKKDVWRCIMGILGAIIGVVLLFSGIQRVLTDVMMAYLVGVCLVCYGVFQIISGWKTRKVKKSTAILGIVCGVLSIIAGILALGHPVLTMISVGYIIAFSVLMQGINMVILSISMKKEKNN